MYKKLLPLGASAVKNVKRRYDEKVRDVSQLKKPGRTNVEVHYRISRGIWAPALALSVGRKEPSLPESGNFHKSLYLI